MSIEAMKQALEALEYIHTETTEDEDELIHAAITALRTAIAEAEKQEPVAWLYWDSWGTMKLSQIMPPPVGAFPVYTAPPAAQRQPLTKERIGQIIEQCKITLVNYCSGEKQTEFARAIEAAHGITGEKT